MIRLYENFKVLMLSVLQVTSEEYDLMLKITREEWLERNSYTRFVRVYARKE